MISTQDIFTFMSGKLGRSVSRFFHSQSPTHSGTHVHTQLQCYCSLSGSHITACLSAFIQEKKTHNYRFQDWQTDTVETSELQHRCGDWNQCTDRPVQPCKNQVKKRKKNTRQHEEEAAGTTNQPIVAQWASKAHPVGCLNGLCRWTSSHIVKTNTACSLKGDTNTNLPLLVVCCC